jgi:hypothetical protein
MTEVSDNFLAAVCELVDTVHGFLLNDGSESDDFFINNMNGCVPDILEEAEEIPALRDWATKLIAKGGIAPKIIGDMVQIPE